MDDKPFDNGQLDGYLNKFIDLWEKETLMRLYDIKYEVITDFLIRNKKPMLEHISQTIPGVLCRDGVEAVLTELEKSNPYP